MIHHQLMNLAITYLQFFLGFLVYILASPLLLTWRLSLYLLLPFAVYKPALSYYQKCRANLYAHPMMRQIVNQWANIIYTILLLLQMTLAFALLEKSLVYFIPWVITHFQRTQYKHEHEEAWYSELILHLAGFMLSCTPFFGVLGVAVGMLYYVRKVRMYERLGNKMTTGQTEARESSMADADDEAMNRFTAVEDETAEHWLAERPCNAEFQTPLYGVAQCSELSLIHQSGHVQGLGESSVSAPPPVVRYKRDRYTPAGVMSIWGSKNGWLAGGYDGRSVRRDNFQEDVEMAEGVGRRE